MIFIVGGGVIGLHLAIALAQKPGRPEIFVCDKEQYLGDHTSGRNSQVIHAGFAYPVDSLKARLCVEGNRLTYEWLRRLKVPFVNEGKWVVAFNEEELPALDKVLEVGAACQVPGLRRADVGELLKKDPACNRFAGTVFSETSGVMDAAAYVRALEQNLSEYDDCYPIYPCTVNGIDTNKKIVQTSRGDMEYSLLINAAGLWSDEIYKMCGGQRDFHIKPFKGEYCVWKHCDIKSLIYPVPRRFLPGQENNKKLVSSMGVHVHRDTGGQLHIGPTQVELEGDRKNDYDIVTAQSEFVRQAAFYAAVKNPDDLELAYAGNRPKLYENGEPFGDFMILHDDPHHLHLLGIESPGLTAAPAIAQYVANLVTL